MMMGKVFLIFCLQSVFQSLYAANIRLVSSSKSSTFIKGILNVYHNGEWGTVCDDYWDIRDTNVACRQLGHGKGLAHMHLGEGSGKIWLDNLACTGSEGSLAACTHNGWGDENCDHGEDIGIVCQIVPDVNVRLVGGSVANEGRVEIRFNSIWGTVCDDYWTLNNANVICKKLGYQKALSSRQFGSGSGQIWLDDVLCRGDEDTIAKCQHRGWGREDCSHDEDIGVVCQPKGSPDISVRLMSGSVSHSGRVEVRYYGVWRSICDTNWDLRDARVICKMKGFSQGAVAFIKGLQSSDDPWMFNLGCGGSESSIESCSSLNWRKGSCANNRRAGVICKSGSPNTAFRLTSGINTNVGRLEVRYYGTWGAACSNTIRLEEAHVVCRVLGYRGAVTIYDKAHTGSILMFSIMMKCTGSETSAEECQNNVVHSNQVKTCAKDVWILCRPSSGLSWKTNLRLVKGSTKEEGRVEMQQFGIWGTLCNTGWDILDANVVCRMLNYTGAITSKQRFGSGSGPIWLTSVRCEGNEKNIMNCAHGGLGRSSSCSHSNDAGVVCHSYSAPNVAVRLVGGSTPNQGRVEVRYYGVWGTVCDDSWGLADAHVVCRMLNYSKASWAGTTSVKGKGLILLDNTACRGSENTLQHCRNIGWGQHDCSHSEDAGVRCATLTKEESSVTVRLVKNALKHVGQVEVKYNGIWRPVCDDTWDRSDAHVICRMLGYKAALAPMRQYMQQNSSLWVGGVECSGDEISISECYHRGWTNSRCPGNYYAGVICNVKEGVLPVGVRLENGSSPNSGRVAVRYGNVWGTICNRGLDINDTKVICRMLGYPGASKVYPMSTFRPGNGTIWVSNLECNGTENSVVNCSHPGWGQTTCNHDNDVAIKCTTVGTPSFVINGSNEVTESTVVLQIDESYPIETTLDGAYQIVVERIVNRDIFISTDHKQVRLPSDIQDVTIATGNGSSLYITAEIPYSPYPSRFTVGDGSYYNEYFNKPLKSGSAYKVHLRIATKSSSGNKVYGDAVFVAFTTNTDNKDKKFFQVHGGVVIALSAVLMVVIAMMFGYFVRLRRRNKNGRKGKDKKTKRKTQAGQDIEMTSPTDEGTIGNYQTLHRGSQEDLEESLYVNVSVPKPYSVQKPFKTSTATTSMATSNLYSSERSLYENVVH